MRTFKSSLIATALIAAGFVGHAQAATPVTQDFNVKLTITATCEFSASADDVDFGTYASNASVPDAAGKLYVTCTPNTPYTIGLSAGSNGTGDVNARKMKRGANVETIAYNLYSDSARNTVWGNTVGTDVVTGSGSGAEQQLSVYGRVTGSTNVTAGNYADIVTATINY